MVADMAGVSRGTVDRVLNNRAHVSPEVYERVMDAIQSTGYLSPRNAYQKTLLNQNFTPLKIGVLRPTGPGILNGKSPTALKRRSRSCLILM